MNKKSNKSPNRSREVAHRAERAPSKRDGQVSDRVIANDEIARSRPNGLNERVEVSGKLRPDGSVSGRVAVPGIYLGIVALLVSLGFTICYGADLPIPGVGLLAILILEITGIITLSSVVIFQQHRRS